MIFHDLWVCCDCYYIHHFGDIGQGHRDNDMTEARNTECLNAYMSYGGDRYVSDNTDSETGGGIDEFSWTSCDCCGSTLGGSRYRLALEDHE